jgi:hypothetical protein
VPAALWAALLWLVALALPSASRFTEVPAFAAPLLVPVAIGFGALAAASTLALVFALRRRVLAVAATLATGMALTTLALFVALLPRLDPELSLRALAATISREMPAGTVLASYHEMEGGLLFYGSGYAQELQNEAELRAFLARHPAVWLVIDPDDLGGLEGPLDLRVVARQGERDDGVKILASP